MSTKSLANTPSFLPETRQRSGGTILGKLRTVVEALSEAKAAADHYETLISRGTPPGEASTLVFRTHFGRR